MKRRSFFQRILSAMAAVAAPRWARAQRLDSGMRELANIVLPASLGRARVERVAADFLVWIRDYRAGAEMPSGYGHPRTQVTPPNPSAHYAEQLAALGSPMRREAVERAITDAKADRIPQRPDGRHVATDLLAFFFNSSLGEDFLYDAKIRRDDCRGLANSAKRPEKFS
ncbi:MAG TPA: hypothetical protein VKX39_09950 [Bryobacteraceae bacterium]|jgi:hypothetical protein|nr:hypothetical protein [Bryobacteraceae bacterium]